MIYRQLNPIQSLVRLTACTVLVAAPLTPAVATELLAHFEYECLRDNGCPHSANSATEARFGVDVYPGSIRFGDYSAGETADITVPIEDYLVEFLTSGSPSTPEPLEFYSSMVGAGGSGRIVDKADLQAGVDRPDPPVRIDAGYDVPLNNGIDLEGTATLTHLRFQLLDLEIFNSDILPGSTMRAHYRFEFLGTRIPEPTSIMLVGLAIVPWVVSRRISQ